MKLTQAQADFVIQWLDWTQDEVNGSEIWSKRDEELWRQILKRYKKLFA